jgi:hypothetical protein
MFNILHFVFNLFFRPAYNRPQYTSVTKWWTDYIIELPLGFYILATVYDDCDASVQFGHNNLFIRLFSHAQIAQIDTRVRFFKFSHIFHTSL